MEVKYVYLSESVRTEEIRNIRSLINFISASVTEVRGSSDGVFIACLCNAVQSELFDYLKKADVMTVIDRDCVSEACPDAVVVGDSML